MLNHVTKVWVAWILTVSQLGFAVGSDWLHQISHHLSHHGTHASPCTHDHGAAEDCHGPSHAAEGTQPAYTCRCDHSKSFDDATSDAVLDRPLAGNSETASIAASEMASGVDAVVDTSSQANIGISACCRPTSQPEGEDVRCWTAHNDYHLCFSSDCSFVQFSKQCGLQGDLAQAFLEYLSTSIAQEIKSQRFSLGTLKTISSRGPPTWLG